MDELPAVVPTLAHEYEQAIGRYLYDPDAPVQEQMPCTPTPNP